MGIDLCCIVKNRFTDRRNPEACAEFIDETIENLTKKYCVEEGAFDFEYHNYGGTFNTFALTTSLWDIVEIRLCVGMWHIMSAVHYCQLFFKGQYWRLLMEEIADALGEKELWLCDENHTYNMTHLPDDIDYVSFDEWHSCVTSNKEEFQNGVIPDYPTAAVLRTPEDKFYPSLGAYHDTTTFYLNRLKEHSKIPEGMTPIGNGVGIFTPMKKDGKLYLVNKYSKSILTNGPIDAYEDCLNSAGFVIIKNGKRILVDLLGNIMSEPTAKPFYWEWGKCQGIQDWPPEIIVKNDGLKKKWHTDSKTGLMTEISTNK